MNHSKPWDVNRLTLSDDEVLQNSVRASERQNERKLVKKSSRFVAGPIPVCWLIKASGLGLRAVKLGQVLWYLRGLKRSPTVTVSNVVAKEWGLTRLAKSRALATLEQAGLVVVERYARKSPRVTLVMPREN